MPSVRNQLLGTLRRRSVRMLVPVAGMPVVGPLASRAMAHIFDDVAAVWDRIRSDPLYLRALGRALAMAEEYLDEPPLTVLDVGCGTGLATGHLAERHPGATITGIDIAPAMIERARRNVPGATFHVGDATRLPYRDDVFDMVVSLDGVFRVRELARVTAPQGVVVIVYSGGGRMPVARPLAGIARALAAAGFLVDRIEDESWIVIGRRARP